MPRGDQLSRQWRLLQMIERPHGVTVEEAAADLRCAGRTVWRDLKVLESAGFPLYDTKNADGPRSRWMMSETFRSRLPLKLGLAEVAALLMSRGLLAPLGASVLGPAVASAFQAIESVLSRDAVRIIDQMREHLGVRALGAKLQLPAGEHLPKIHAALAGRHTLRMRYYSASRDREDDRDVDPYHLTLFNGGLYLVGRCHLRRAVRIFAVERMRTVEALRARFEAPGGFSVERYLQGAWGILRGDLVTVRVVFARALAPYIRERLWHPSQALTDVADGRLEMTLQVADTLEVRRWILGYGVQAEVLEPASLREALRAEAQALAAKLTPRRAPLAVARRDAPAGARTSKTSSP